MTTSQFLIYLFITFCFLLLVIVECPVLPAFHLHTSLQASLSPNNHTLFFLPVFSSLLYWRFVVHSPLGGLRGMRTAFTHDAKGEIWCEPLQRPTGNQSRPDSTCCVTLSSSRHPSACLGRLLNPFISFLFLFIPVIMFLYDVSNLKTFLGRKLTPFVLPSSPI